VLLILLLSFVHHYWLNSW